MRRRLASLVRPARAAGCWQQPQQMPHVDAFVVMFVHLSGCQVLVRVGVVMPLRGIDGALVHSASKLAAKLAWRAVCSWFTRSPNTPSWYHKQHQTFERGCVLWLIY